MRSENLQSLVQGVIEVHLVAQGRLLLGNLADFAAALLRLCGESFGKSRSLYEYSECHRFSLRRLADQTCRQVDHVFDLFAARAVGLKQDQQPVVELVGCATMSALPFPSL